MTDLQFIQLHDVIVGGWAVVCFALGYIGGYAQ